MLLGKQPEQMNEWEQEAFWQCQRTGGDWSIRLFSGNHRLTINNLFLLPPKCISCARSFTDLICRRQIAGELWRLLQNHLGSLCLPRDSNPGFSGFMFPTACWPEKVWIWGRWLTVRTLEKHLLF